MIHNDSDSDPGSYPGKDKPGSDARDGHGDRRGDGPGNGNVIDISVASAGRRIREAQEKIWRMNETRPPYAAGRPDAYGGNGPDASGKLINLPPVTGAVLALLAVIQCALFLFASDLQREYIFTHFGFTPASYWPEVPFQEAMPGWVRIAGPFTYMFLHGSWLHFLMNGAMLAAFGAGIEKEAGGARMFLLFFASALCAALAHFIVQPFSIMPVIGASGGISGLFGAVIMLYARQGRLQTGRWGILPFVAFWIVISIIFGMTGSPDGGAVAWVAHIGGFIAGLVLFRPLIEKKKFRRAPPPAPRR